MFKLRRKHYFIHFSVQFKYLVMAMAPALLLSIFCTSFLMQSGDVFMQKAKAKLAVEIAFINETIQGLSKQDYPPGLVQKVGILKERLSVLQENLDMQYFGTLQKWAQTKMDILCLLALVLIICGIISVIFSHRIAGPIYRLRKSIEMLSEGKDIPSFAFRKRDEFQEVAASFEKLRKFIKEKGVLK